MSDRLVDLNQPGTVLPQVIAADSNVVITWLESSSPRFARLREVGQVVALFHTAQTQGISIVLTPFAFSEVVHSSVKALYGRARVQYQSRLQSHYGRPAGFSWLDLYKIEPDVLRQNQLVLEQLRAHLQAARVVLPDLGDFASLPSARTFTLDLVRLVGRFGLDTYDAAILIEAKRLGIDAIVSFDRDMRRAAADFDVYTWLDPD